MSQHLLFSSFSLFLFKTKRFIPSQQLVVNTTFSLRETSVYVIRVHSSLRFSLPIKLQKFNHSNETIEQHLPTMLFVSRFF